VLHKLQFKEAEYVRKKMFWLHAKVGVVQAGLVLAAVSCYRVVLR